MFRPLISVVIPSYNYGRFVADAIRSALRQDYVHREIIVVDDGSTDDTRQRLAPFMEQIRYIYQENQGLSAARNTGIRAAHGEFIALLDSDDVWHPRKLTCQVACQARHPETGILATDHVVDLTNGWPVFPDVPAPAIHNYSLDELVLRCRFAPSSAMIRKECFEQVGLFDADLRSVEDRDMWIRIACRYPVAKLCLPLCWYRIHDSNLSHVAVRMEEHELKVLRKAFATLPALQGRTLFRAKAFGLAAHSAAHMYGSARNWWRALSRLMRSLLLWPLPFSQKEVNGHFVRLRMLAVLILRMLGLKKPEPVQRGTTPGAVLEVAASDCLAATR